MRQHLLKLYTILIILFLQNSFSQTVTDEVFKTHHPKFSTSVNNSNRYLQKKEFIEDLINYIQNNIDLKIINDLELVESDLIAFNIKLSIDEYGTFVKDSLVVQSGGVEILDNYIKSVFSTFPKIFPATNLKSSPIHYSLVMNMEFIVKNNKLFGNRYLDPTLQNSYLSINNIIYPEVYGKCNYTKPDYNCFNKSMSQMFKDNVKLTGGVGYNDVYCIIYIGFTYTKEGKIVYKFYKTHCDIANKINFERDLKNSIESLPKLEPIIEYGIPIDKDFTMPIRLRLL